MWVRKHAISLIMALVSPVATLCAQPITVSSAFYTAEANQAKIILGVTESPKYRVYVLDNPARLVIDFKSARVKQDLSQPSASHPLFKRVRIAPTNDPELRVVVDLKQPVTARTHKLATSNIENKKIVINLQNKHNQIVNVKELAKAEKLNNTSPTSETKSGLIEAASKNNRTSNKKRFIVAIDAGHGGDDPGATGPSGTREKVVTLAIAKKLQVLINGQPGMKAKLVRKGDYYVGLRERMRLARLNRADLFVSIHADAVNNPDVRGASVYTLSRNGASSEAARWLANQENAKERIGGVNLDDKDEVLASVLLDLSQTATQQASVTLANKVLRHFQGVGGLHYQSVQKAGFAVLKSPDIPSILVETAYISNPSDELNLNSVSYQNKIADAIFKGILNYVEQIEPSELNKVAKL